MKYIFLNNVFFFFLLLLLTFAINIVAATSPTSHHIYNDFTAKVAPEANDPHRFKQMVHLRTGLGRVTHFEYDATKHDKIILPHDQDGLKVIACTENTVTIQVSKNQISLSNSWTSGWKFTTTKDHYECPSSSNNMSTIVYYREIVNKTTVGINSDGGKTILLTTKNAIFSDFFKTLSMKMYSSHIVHKDEFSTPPLLPNNNNKNRRELFNSRTKGYPPTRRLKFKKFIHKAGKWVKKKILKPAEEAAKFLATGKADKTWEKDFAINWNYDKERGEAAKTIPIHGQTACTSCYFHADAGYKVEIDVKHYKLESVMAEVYGDVELNLAMTNPGPAIDVKKLDKVMDNVELFSIKFMIGPVPICVKLHLDVDLGYHFTVSEIGNTPDVTARGEGHIRFGKQYKRGMGWEPINSHTLDLDFDSDGGTVKADMYLYANIVPKLSIEHIGDVAVTVTPAVDVGIIASLPKASCDFKPLKDKHASCVASEGEDNQGCSLSLDVTPSINVEMNIEVDVELFHKSLYKKTFDPMILFQKTFAINGFPKCLISSWSKSNNNKQRRRHLLLRENGNHDDGRILITSSPDSDNGKSIRDANLTNPRVFLQQRGRSTLCPNDCSGQGFCINTTSTGRMFQCVCQESWTGSDCSTKLMWVVDRSNYKTNNAGVTTRSNGLYPEPNICGHGTVVKTTEQVAIDSLSVCKGRTSANICASRNDMKALDTTIGSVLKEYVTMGYPCGAAMAELQCRISFPAILDTTSKRIAPISYESCLDLFTACLGESEADEICTDTSAIGGSHAGISLANSPWQLASLPSLFDAEHASNNFHKKCLPVDDKLDGCPSTMNKMVHINTDIWTSVDEVDAFVSKSMKELVDGGMTDVNCLNANREQLCAVHMPICNKYGNQIKMTYDECVNMVQKCPSLPQKSYQDYGLSGPSDPAYPKQLCSDKSEFFVRNFVGEHPVVCGLEQELGFSSSKSKNNGGENGDGTTSSDMPWHQNVHIVGILALIVGFILGAVVIKFIVVNIVQKHNKHHNIRNTNNPMMNNDDGITNIPATGLKVEMQSGKTIGVKDDDIHTTKKSRNTWAKNAI